MVSKVFKLMTVLLLSLLCSCRGVVDDNLPLTIKADRTVIPADGLTAVTFSVFKGLENVTASSRINNLSTGKRLEGNEFTSTTAGQYEFSADYQGQEVEETVFVEVEAVIESRFVRNVCLMEFTDASCTFCPAASLYIDRNIMQKIDNVHLMAFHDKDQWAFNKYSELSQLFDFEEQPYAVVDMRDALSLAESARDKVKEAVVNSSRLNPTHCGLSLTSGVSNGKAVLGIRLFSEKTTEYRLAIYVVEDGIIGAQAGQLVENYYHQFVVRKMISATIHGDNVGVVASGQEKAREYTVELDPSWNLAKTYIYVMALDTASRVNNMQVCLIQDGTADYEYKN